MLNREEKINNDGLLFISFADKEMIEQYLTLALSINRIYRKCKIVLITDQESIDLVNETKISKKLNLNLLLYEKYISSEYFSKHVGLAMNKDSVLRFGRLFISEVVNDLDYNGKIIYLDSDIILRKKIKKKYLNSKNNISFLESEKGTKQFKRSRGFWKYFLSEYDIVQSEILKKHDENNYFNSGVILINNLKDYMKIIDRIMMSKYRLNDQTLLNYYNNGEIMVINDFTQNSFIERRFDLNASVYHMAGTNARPWLDNVKEHKIAWKFLYFWSGWNNCNKKIRKWLEK